MAWPTAPSLSHFVGPIPQTSELNTLGYWTTIDNYGRLIEHLFYVSCASICRVRLKVGDTCGLCGWEGVGIWLGFHDHNFSDGIMSSEAVHQPLVADKTVGILFSLWREVVSPGGQGDSGC